MRASYVRTCMKFLVILIGIIGAGAAGYYLGYDHGYERAAADYEEAEELPDEVERYMDIETYVRTSISELSPVKEVLGGTFYVTKIETADGNGIVEYEDGHIALIADFTYTIDEVGKPTLTSFTVRE